MFNYCIIGITYAFACVVQPGPFQAFLFAQSLAKGWRKTIPLVFAPLISDIPVICLVLLVLTQLPGLVLHIIQCVGGLFLFYLAYGAYKTWRDFYKNNQQPASVQKNLLKAIVVSLLNPNPYLGWSLVMGPLLIKAWGEKPIIGILFLVSFYSSLVVCSIIMVGLFAAARNLGPRINKILIGISAIALAIFGGYQILSGIFSLS
ncbi:MAG: LysE family transporter [Bacteroidota bacterium]